MRIHILILLTTFALAAFGVGCQSSSSSAAPPAVATIEGVNWQLVNVGGRPAEPVPAGDRAASFRLDAAAKRVSGYGGVNRLMGTYRLSGQSLTFETLAMTRRAGPEPLMRQESALTRAMELTASWRSAGRDEIELLDAGGKPLARFERG